MNTGNTWTEIKLVVNKKDLDLAESIAQMATNLGIYTEDYSNLEEEAMEIAHIDLFDEELIKKDRVNAIIHIYISEEYSPEEVISFVTERMKSENIDFKLDMDTCMTEDWINNWKKYFKPIPVGNKLLIHPIWEDEVDPMGRTVIHLEPGLAFGTGTHETTRLCLETLEKYVKEGDEVLDVGCGSGILSIAALLLGAKRAVGIDIDELAVKTAIENAQMNKVEDKFEAICGDLTDKVSGKYKIVVANIVADIIVKLTKDIKLFLTDDATYIMSGIIDTRKDDVLNCLKDDFDIIEIIEENGWVAIAAKAKV